MSLSYSYYNENFSDDSNDSLYNLAQNVNNKHREQTFYNTQGEYYNDFTDEISISDTVYDQPISNNKSPKHLKPKMKKKINSKQYLYDYNQHNGLENYSEEKPIKKKKKYDFLIILLIGIILICFVDLFCD